MRRPVKPCIEAGCEAAEAMKLDSTATEANNFLYHNREAWLKAAIAELAPTFERVGITLPENLRCAIGFPSTGRRGGTIGECWSASRSADRHVEIFVRCDHDNPFTIIDILTHELIHAGLPEGAGHGKLFRLAALKLGLQGPMRHASAGPLLREFLTVIAGKLGPLPHARLNFAHGRPNRPGLPDQEGQEGQEGIIDAPDTRKPQSARMLKAQCPSSGYTCRVARKWLASLGAPVCPCHQKPMTVEQWQSGEREGRGEQPNQFDDLHAGEIDNGSIAASIHDVRLNGATR